LQSKEEVTQDDQTLSSVTQIDSALQTIRILGQILRNNAGEIDGGDKILIVKEVYFLAARVLGLMLGAVGEDLDQIVEHLVAGYKKEGAGEPAAAIRKKIAKEIFGMVWYGTYGMCRWLGEALSHEMLTPCFEQVLLNLNGELLYRVFDLAVDLDHADVVPLNKAKALYDDSKDNRFVEVLVRALVVEYLYLYDVRYDVKQKIADKLNIDIPKRTYDLSRKRISTQIKKEN
jgi:hypothetical protein